jgi:haloacetate dehalogenase
MIKAPLLVLCGTRDDLPGLYDHDVLGVWRPWAADLSGYALDSGHHMTEEAPGELASALRAFFGNPPRERRTPANR